MNWANDEALTRLSEAEPQAADVEELVRLSEAEPQGEPQWICRIGEVPRTCVGDRARPAPTAVDSKDARAVADA